MPGEPDGSLSPLAEAEQAKLRNTERQKQLVADTQRLLSLANELKADVDKSTKDTLSLDVVRKADEIEKLAHIVKEKMKCSGCN
jgi:nitric oxide reductase activation protein